MENSASVPRVAAAVNPATSQTTEKVLNVIKGKLKLASDDLLIIRLIIVLVCKVCVIVQSQHCST